MGALIALLVACEAPPDDTAPQIGVVSVGWDPSGPVFSAAFWEGPSVTATPVRIAGGCVLVVDEAMADRVPLSAGRLRLSAPDFDVVSQPEDLYLTVFYPPPDLAGAPWGGVLSVESEGADLPAFQGELALPSRVWSIEFGPDATLQWEPSGADAVELAVEADSRPGERWWCVAPDDGVWTVPEAIRQRASAPDRLRIQWRISKGNAVDTGGGSVSLVGWTGEVGAIDLP